MTPYRYAFRAMGSPCELRLYARHRAEADAGAAAAQAQIRRLEDKYSRYRDDSLATRINRSAGDAAGIQVDAETAALLDYADTAWRHSEGLFDLSSGVLRRAWDFKRGRPPAQEALDALLPLVGWQRLRWDRPRLCLPLPGMELDFGGCVKEYAADCAARACRAAGLRHGLVELGGDIALVGPHPDGAPWRIGVRDPHTPGHACASIALVRGAIASSGDYERGFVHAGHRYGHILDPRSGWPCEGLSGVSIVADECLVAGTAATVAMLKSEAAALAWLEALGLPQLCIARDGTMHGRLRQSAGPAATSWSSSEPMTA